MSNRAILIRGMCVAAVAVATLSACAPSSRPQSAAQPSTQSSGRPSAPARTGTTVTPYVDVSLTDPPLVAMADATGVVDAVLAFGLATGGDCTPSWGGSTPLDSPAVTAGTAELLRRGGRLTVATGGASGDYLENACAGPADLAGAYTRLLDATGATRLDVDVETDVPTATVVDALHRVQQQRGVDVSLTLPVADQHRGLDDDGLALARAAAAAGLRFDVDALVMDFPAGGSWPQAMTGALAAARTQVAALSPTPPGLAATIMVGRTDTGPVTTLDDARTVAQDAVAHGVADLRLWSLGRDNGGCAGAEQARPDCSGVAQQDFAFTQALRDVARAVPATPTGRNGT